MVLVQVGTVVVLTTGKTTTTRVLSVLADTTLTGRDVATAAKRNKSAKPHVKREMHQSRCCWFPESRLLLVDCPATAMNLAFHVS
jgi:hypothetical protein